MFSRRGLQQGFAPPQSFVPLGYNPYLMQQRQRGGGGGGMGIILFIFLLVVGLGVAGYFFLNSPIDNNSSKGDNEEEDDDDYEEDGDEDDDEDEEEDEEDEDSVPQGDASLTTKTVGNTTSTQDPTQTVSMEDTVEQVCTDDVVQSINPFCKEYKLFVFKLGRAGEFGDVEMILAIDGKTKSNLQDVKAFLWFSDDRNGEYIPTNVGATMDPDTIGGAHIKFTIPFGDYWPLFKEKSGYTGYKKAGLQMHGFEYRDMADDGKLALVTSLDFFYYLGEQKMIWYRPAETDYVVERKKEDYNNKVKALLNNKTVYWHKERQDVRNHASKVFEYNSITFNSGDWRFKEDQDGYITPYHTNSKNIKLSAGRSIEDVAWPRGFRFGGRSGSDRGHRVYELRWVPPNGNYGIYKGNSTNTFSAVDKNNNQRGSGNKGKASSKYNNVGHRVLHNGYIAHGNITEESNNWGIWGSQEDHDGPEDIYLSFEPGDTAFWKNKYPPFEKPTRNDRTLSVKANVDGYKAEDFILV